MPLQKSVPQVRKDFQEKIDKAGEFYYTRMPAVMGNYTGVVRVPDTQNMVYVRVESGQVIKVFNSIAPNIYNWKVFIGIDKSQPGVLKVLEVRWTYNLAQTVAYVLFHHTQHEYPNPDTVWVMRDQFMPLLVLPKTTTQQAILYGDVIYTTGMTAPIKVDTQDLDLTPYALLAGAKYVLLEILTDGTLNYIEGDVYGSKELLILTAPIPTPTTGSFPVCVFIVYESQTTFRRDSTERTIIDLRMFTSNATPLTGDEIGTAPADTPLDADKFGFWDVVDSLLKSITWANLKLAIKAYTDTLYSVLGHTHSLVTEDIQDIVGAMVSGNTESSIDVTYDDSSGKLNFDVTRELIMEDGVTFPPVPLTTEDGTDWLYSG